MTKQVFWTPSLVAIVVGGLAPPVAAQQNWSDVAVPAYSAAEILAGLYGKRMANQAGVLGAKVTTLNDSLGAYCNARAPGAAGLEQPRRAWREAMLAWEPLGTVALGPVVERRTMRQIDFAPTRPALIERAIKSQPRGAQALERIGTPAKGLPALEWLLWTQPAQPSTPACDYAIEVARDLGREVQAVQAGFVAQATAVSVEEPEPELLRQGFEQFVNQWLGGLNRLRWAQIDKPRQAARSAGEATPDWPRAASGSTMAAWSSQWQALHQLAVLDTRDAPAPGTAAVPIETLLRSRGLNPLADRWRDAVQVADGVMTRVRLDDAPSLDDATRALGVVQERLEGEVAPALEVGIGFSDADGD